MYLTTNDGDGLAWTRRDRYNRLEQYFPQGLGEGALQVLWYFLYYYLELLVLVELVPQVEQAAQVEVATQAELVPQVKLLEYQGLAIFQIHHYRFLNLNQSYRLQEEGEEVELAQGLVEEGY